MNNYCCSALLTPLFASHGFQSPMEKGVPWAIHQPGRPLRPIMGQPCESSAHRRGPPAAVPMIFLWHHGMGLPATGERVKPFPLILTSA